MTFGRQGSKRLWIGVVVALAALVATSCSTLVQDEVTVSSDLMAGRQNGTQGSSNAQGFLMYRLRSFAEGYDQTKSGDDAFKQPFDGGTNILAKIPGTDLADQYVVIGAHYDHLGNACRTSDPADTICNGATDNGAGVAALLSIGEMIKARGAPRRTVILAFWDREEDGLLGSKYYTQHPVAPLAQTAAYINFDIQGANLLPSLQNSSFAVGAETGGPAFSAAVKAAIAPGALDTRLVSSIFGQNRSDYVNFTAVGVPNVFFSDSTGPCYHTAQDNIGVVDFWKLDQQVKIAYRLAISVIDSTQRPTFTAGTPLATFDDALALQAVSHLAVADVGRFTPAQQTQLLKFRDDVDAIVAAGSAAFDATKQSALLTSTSTAVSLLTSGPCDGFISHH
jgi:Peptidase family M28